MKAALTQMNIIWENPDQTKKICKRLTKKASEQGCDWIIFPEMTLTGFTMHPEKFQEHEKKELTPTRQFFRNLSLEYSICIAYGTIAFDNGSYYNQLILESKGSTLLEYSKIHPFSYGEESLHYAGGNAIALGRQSGICFSGFICYDLRFPEVFQIASQEASVIFVIANWPKSRISHWYTLLQARAIENQCFIIGVNRTGEGNGIPYIPSSVAFNPYGECITSETEEELLYADIDSALADQYRKDFPLKVDRRNAFYREFM